MSENITELIPDEVADKIVPYKEIIASLISSATAIRNTDCITRAMYAQIEEHLTECKAKIAANMEQFDREMKLKEGFIFVYRYALDLLQERIVTASGEDLLCCIHAMESIINDMTQLGINSSDNSSIIKLPYI